MKKRKSCGISKREKWAKERNWLILRVRGAMSVLINRVATGIAIIDEKISKSKWKE